jgi:hypothetical protein
MDIMIIVLPFVLNVNTNVLPVMPILLLSTVISVILVEVSEKMPLLVPVQLNTSLMLMVIANLVIINVPNVQHMLGTVLLVKTLESTNILVVVHHNISMKLETQSVNIVLKLVPLVTLVEIVLLVFLVEPKL